MESILKKVSILIMSFLFVVACTLSGCAGFSINRVKYYNEVIATVGDSEITRFDLLNAYNSYGYNYYVTQQSYEENDALIATLDLLINREALYLYAKNDAEQRFTPTVYQVNALIEDIFDSLDEQMDTYITTAESVLNITSYSNESATESTSDDTAYIYEEYQKRAELVYDNEKEAWVIHYLGESEPTDTSSPIIEKSLLSSYSTSTEEYNKAISAIREKYLSQFRESLNNDYSSENATKIYNKVISLLTDNLIEYEYYLRDENGNEYSKTTNDLLFRYFSRAFDSSIQSQYLTNVQTEYLAREDANLSINALLDAYNQQVMYDTIVYGGDLENYKTTIQSISTDGDTIFYHPDTEDGTQFGYFIHMLIMFDDDENALIENVSEDELNDLYNQILAQKVIHPRDPKTGLSEIDKTTGELVEKTINDVMDDYMKILSYDSYSARLNAFIKFMYKYTEDPGLLSGGMPYVVGTNGYTDMVEEFTAEAENLMTGKSGNQLTNSLNYEGNMTAYTPETEFSDLCISTNGLHLLFYIGDVSKFDSKGRTAIISGDSANENQFNLYYEIINPLINQTYFDLLFDTVYPADSDGMFTSNTGYSTYETNLAETSKNTYKVVRYTDKINHTYTSI